jgi:hypothetical protein
MVGLFRSLLLVIAGASQKELARQIRYLKVEDQFCGVSCRRESLSSGASATAEIRCQTGQGAAATGHHSGTGYVSALDS